jgi:hypothetical protein
MIINNVYFRRMTFINKFNTLFFIWKIFLKKNTSLDSIIVLFTLSKNSEFKTKNQLEVLLKEYPTNAQSIVLGLIFILLVIGIFTLSKHPYTLKYSLKNSFLFFQNSYHVLS